MGFLMHMLAQVEIVDLSIPNEYKFLVFLFGALLVISLFVPFYLYADATRRQKNGLAWAAGAFFSMALLEVIGLASANFGAWVVLSVLAVLAPYGFLFAYLMLRTPLTERVCATCGRELDPSWKTCPYCEVSGVSVKAAQGAPMYVPPPARQSEDEPGSGSRERKSSTLVKQRKEKRTVRKKEKQQGQALGWLVVKKGKGVGKEHRITQEVLTIGRDVSNDIVVADDEMSRQHARVRVEDGKFVVYDLGSANGTRVNGEEIQKAVLEDGDYINMGTTEFTFKKV